MPFDSSKFKVDEDTPFTVEFWNRFADEFGLALTEVQESAKTFDAATQQLIAAALFRVNEIMEPALAAIIEQAEAFDPENYFTAEEAETEIAAAVTALVDGASESFNTLAKLAAALALKANASEVQSGLNAKQAASALLTALAGVNDNGLIARTGSGAASARAITAGTGVTVENGSGASGNPAVAIDKASAANVRAAASNKVLTADLIETASAWVALTDAGTVAVDWDAFISAEITLEGSRTLGNPTNGQPGTTRYIMVKGNNSTDRTLSFGNQYLGDLPVITDADNTKWYLLAIVCYATNHFVVTATVARKP